MGRFERRMDSEMRFHVEQLVERYRAGGLSAAEARRRALQEFGGVELAKDEVRDFRPLDWLRTVAGDLRYAVRCALRAPGFSLAVTATLALAIGSAVAVFGVVYTVLLRPLPYPDPARLVWVENRTPGTGKPNSVHMLQYQQWKNAASFESLAAFNQFYEQGGFNLTGRGVPERLPGIHVTANLLPMLGAQMAAGRGFLDSEDQPGARPAIILSYGFWQRRFGADPAIVGQSLDMNDKPHTVVGVLAPSFAFAGTVVPASNFDVYLPLIQDKQSYRYGMYLGLLGRLKPGISAEQARQQTDSLHQAALGDTPLKNFRPQIGPLSARVNASLQSPLWILLGAVFLLVFTGCANLANLFLARASARGREMAMRAALGAGRGRLIRQLLTESGMPAVLGAGAGMMLAASLLRWLRRVDWLNMPRLAELGIHWQVALFAVLTCVFTTLAFGLAPALRAGRADGTAAMKPSLRGAGTGARGRLRWALVAAQVGFSFVLLAGSGLLIRSLLALLDVSPGFQPRQTVALRVDPGDRRERGPKMTLFFDEILARVRQIPGVESAALAVNLPLDRNMRWEYKIPGWTAVPGVMQVAAARMVSPGYFHTMGIRLSAGRDFTPRDIAGAPFAVVVNRTLAREIASLREPVGSKMVVRGAEHEVIGIVDDVKHEGLERESGPEVYLAQAQTLPFPVVDVVVRSAQPNGQIAAAVREAVWAVDPNQPVGKLQTLEGLLDRSISPRRFFTTILAALAAFALLLAFAGVYGVVSYGVSQRRPEIGIRMALGAASGDVLRLFVRESALAALAGLAIGIPAAAAFARVMSAQLYGVPTLDPLSFACAGAVVAGCVLAATLIPARRAIRLDPRQALAAD